MNILAFNNFNTPNFSLHLKNENANIKSAVPQYGLKMSAPLQSDTVSFGATAKNVNRIISSKVGNDIEKNAKHYELQVSAIFMSILTPLISTEEKPNNTIEYFSVRTKSRNSIAAKSGEVKGDYVKGELLKNGKKCKEKDAITLNMTDILGAKSVLTNGTKQNAKKVIDCFTNAIKNGQLRLREIEQKVPKSCEKDQEMLARCAYANDTTLDKMKLASEKRFGNNVATNYRDYTSANYSALHFLFDVLLKDQNDKPIWKTVEFQLIGHDVNAYKGLDDILYKLLNGKDVDKKYNQLRQVLKPIILPKELYDLYNEHNQQHKIKCKNEGKKFRALTYAQFVNALTKDDLTAIKCPKYIMDMSKEELITNMKCRDSFNHYRAEVFLSQRLKGTKPHENRLGYDGKIIVDFLPITDPILPLKYSMNSLYQLKNECETN